MSGTQSKNEKELPGTAWLRAMRHLSFVIFLASLFPALAFGQSANRWLLIYNTSASMRDRVEGVEAVTQDLLSTAMHGNLRAGDTIGIWTYDNQLRANEAPLLTWSPDDARAIDQKTLQFLSHHAYEKTAAFGDVLVNLLHVVKISDVVTIVLISDANDPISGTPFDARLNAFYRANSQKQKKTRMPVVTVFRGEHGILTTNTVALSPWPVDIPAVPPPVVVKAALPKPSSPPAPVRPVPSLVMVGDKAVTTFKPAAQLPDPTDEPAPPVAPVTKPAVVQPKPEATKAEVSPSAPRMDEKPNVPAPAVVSAEPAHSPVTTLTPKAVETAPSPAAVAVVASNVPAVKPIAPASAPTVETAAAEASPNLFSGRNIAIASAAFAALVCVLLLLAARNARNASRTSLITRSLDRERK